MKQNQQYCWQFPMISHDIPMVGCPHWKLVVVPGRGSRYWHRRFHQLQPYLLHLRYQGPKPDAPRREWRRGSWEGHFFKPLIYDFHSKGRIYCWYVLLKEGRLSKNYLASAKAAKEDCGSLRCQFLMVNCLDPASHLLQGVTRLAPPPW